MKLSFLRRWWPIAAVTALLALTALTAAHSALRLRRVDGPVPENKTSSFPTDLPTQPPRRAGRAAEVEPFDVPDWLFHLVSGLAVLITLVAIGLLLRVLLRDRLRMRGSGPMPASRARHSSAGTTRELVAALDAGLTDLDDADGDPRRAVIACWVRLEQAAASAGVPRHVGDTPTDLVTRLLAERATVSADVLARFADVYRQARYATHAVDERMREQARAALHRLRAELTTPAGGAGADPTANMAGAGAGAGAGAVRTEAQR